MAISYATRIATQQAAPITLRISARSQLSAPFNNAAFTSTYGRNVFLDTDYSTAPADGTAINFPAPGSVNQITVDRSSLDNTFGNSGQIVIGDNILALSGETTGGGGTNIYNCAKTLMPVSGSTTEIRANITIAVGVGDGEAYYPLSSILNTGGILRAAIAGNPAQLPDPNGGDVILINVALMTGTVEVKWEGLDATTTGMSNPAWRAKDNSLGNWALFSGVYTNLNATPLLVDANLDGTENGRYNISLSDPTWDALWSQPGASAVIAQCLPCNVGWYAAISAGSVSPPSFFVFNEDMTQYWVYVIQAQDAETTTAIFNPSWGFSFSESLWINSILTDQGQGGEIQILGAPGNPSLLMQNTGEANLSRLLLPPYPPIISAKCVPCAPLQIGPGDTWKTRFA